MEEKADKPYHLYRWEELTNKQAGTTDEENYEWEWKDSGIMGWVNRETDDVILEHSGELSDELWENWCREHHCPDANVPLQAEYTIRQKLVTQFMQMQWFKQNYQQTFGYMSAKSDNDFTAGKGGIYFTVPADMMCAIRDRTGDTDDLRISDEEYRIMGEQE